jgi:hypothetical protein
MMRYLEQAVGDVLTDAAVRKLRMWFAATDEIAQILRCLEQAG